MGAVRIKCTVAVSEPAGTSLTMRSRLTNVAITLSRLLSLHASLPQIYSDSWHLGKGWRFDSTQMSGSIKGATTKTYHGAPKAPQSRPPSSPVWTNRIGLCSTLLELQGTVLPRIQEFNGLCLSAAIVKASRLYKDSEDRQHDAKLLVTLLPCILDKLLERLPQCGLSIIANCAFYASLCRIPEARPQVDQLLDYIEGSPHLLEGVTPLDYVHILSVYGLVGRSKPQFISVLTASAFDKVHQFSADDAFFAFQKLSKIGGSDAIVNKVLTALILRRLHQYSPSRLQAIAESCFTTEPKAEKLLKHVQARFISPQ